MNPILAILIKYKKVILAVLLSLGFLFALGYGIIYLQDYVAQSKLDKQRAEVNTQLQEAANINLQIANLEEKKVAVESNANFAIIELQKVQEDTNKAQQNSNQAAENVNKVENKNYNTISVIDANKARCRTFPSDPGC